MSTDLRPGWFQRPGSLTSHRLRAGTNLDVTSCGRQMRGGWVAANDHSWRCGQCLRRETPRHGQ